MFKNQNLNYLTKKILIHVEDTPEIKYKLQISLIYPQKLKLQKVNISNCFIYLNIYRSKKLKYLKTILKFSFYRVKI